MKPYYEDTKAGIVIYHGDCREVLPTLGPVDVLVTDPPYGISYQHGTRKGGVALGTDGLSVIGDDAPFDPVPYLGFDKVILWGANHYADRLPASRGCSSSTTRCRASSTRATCSHPRRLE